MSLSSYLFGIAAALLVLLVVVEMLRRRRLRERHAIWWFLAGVIALVTSAFPPVLRAVAGAVGVQVPSNLVFFLSSATLFLVSIQHSAELTALETKTRILVERLALQELRLERLENGERSGSERE